MNLTLEPFLIRALLAGIGVAFIAGPMGCFVVWRRMAYFGDSLAHSALLGIALGLAVGISTTLATIAVCSVFALLLVWLQQKKLLASDTLLGILAHGALSFGLITMSLLEQRADLYAYLFGDILTVSARELWWIYGGGAFVLALLAWNWRAFLLMSVSEDLARAEGIRTFWIQLLLMFLIAVVVAVSIRIVGILLISSLLIIPAATARQVARSPEAMAVYAGVLGVVAVGFGLVGSLAFDTPSGPSIVVASALFFIVFFGVFSGRKG